MLSGMPPFELRDMPDVDDAAEHEGEQEAVYYCWDLTDRKNGEGVYDQREALPGERLLVFVGSYFTRLPMWLPYSSAYCTPVVCHLNWR